MCLNAQTVLSSTVFLDRLGKVPKTGRQECLRYK